MSYKVPLLSFVFLILCLGNLAKGLEGLRIQDAGVPKAQIEYDLVTDVLSIIAPEASSQISLVTNGVERIHIDHAGNVGIGSASPGEALSVSGVIESTSGGIKFPDGTIQTTATTHGVIDSLVIQSAGTFSTTSLCPSFVDLPGSSKSITLTSPGNVVFTWHLGFYVNGGPNGGTVRACIGEVCGGSKNLYSNETLSHKTISGSWTVSIGSGEHTAKLQICSGSVHSVNQDLNDSISWVIHGGTGGSGGDNLGNHVADQNIDLSSYKLVGNGGSEGIAISSDGRVGVGTETPSADLDVNGRIKAVSVDLPVQTITATSPLSPDFMEVTASCPANHIVIGGGCQTICCAGQLIANRPSGDTAWYCSALHPYNPASYSTTAYAIRLRNE